MGDPTNKNRPLQKPGRKKPTSRKTPETKTDLLENRRRKNRGRRKRPSEKSTSGECARSEQPQYYVNLIPERRLSVPVQKLNCSNFDLFKLCTPGLSGTQEQALLRTALYTGTYQLFFIFTTIPVYKNASTSFRFRTCLFILPCILACSA